MMAEMATKKDKDLIGKAMEAAGRAIDRLKPKPWVEPGWKGCRECGGVLMQDGIAHDKTCSVRHLESVEILWRHPDSVPAPMKGCPCPRCEWVAKPSDLTSAPVSGIKLPLSPALAKNKYHDAVLDAVADLAVEVGAPLDIIVELHPDHDAKGYVVRLYREEKPLEGAAFKLGIQDVVQINPTQLQFLVLGALKVLTGVEYKQKPKPLLPLGAPAVVPAGPRILKGGVHDPACICMACKKKPKLQARAIPPGQTDPDAPIARRPIDPTKVLDLGDRVMDLE